MRQAAVVESLFGVEVSDPHRWLEDANDAGVRAWSDERDRNTRTFLAGLPERAALVRRLEELFYVEQRTVPIRRGGRYFYGVRPTDAEKTVHVVREGRGGAERVLLDPNRMSEDGSLSIGGVYPSPDGKLLAYLEKPNNADRSVLKVLDVDTGSVRGGDTIAEVWYTFPSWLPDGSGFFYTGPPPGSNPAPEARIASAELRLHRLGTDAATDITHLPATGDPSKLLTGEVSHDGKYLLASIHHGWGRCEVLLRRLGSDDSRWRKLTDGKDAVYGVAVHRGRLYVLTNEGAPNYRIFGVDPDSLERETWEELVPEESSSVIEHMGIVGDHLVLRRLRAAESEIEVRRLDGTFLRRLDLPERGTVSMLVGEPDVDEAFFSFSSFTRPPEIHSTSVANGGLEVHSRQDVPVVSGDFEVRQEWCTSKDGTQVPLFIVHRRGLEMDGQRPTILYGYGGFNVVLSPEFTPSLFPWLERGGVYAMANLRGGGELGEDWHRAGMLEKKQNVFDDFIAAAEHLVAAGYTSPPKLSISGGSNGGLLVGAAMTQRPELFRAVICSVPVLDMLRYHRFGVGKAWIPEYGDPEDEEAFWYLFEYSPYHRLQDGVAYPLLLVDTAEGDDRVDPMHARKFVARVEEASTRGEGRALLRVEAKAGHGGADRRRQGIERVADHYAFLLWALGEEREGPQQP
jgi:prolyl oligopeptidase